ncbi:MAG: alpha,alpha-trehalase [Arcticibacterium sp.]|jgi:alpha,alpha-trehalase
MKFFKVLSFSLLLLSCSDSTNKKEYKSPEDSFPGLFEEVQLKVVFPDSKTFVDCVPKYQPSFILSAYEEQKALPDFDLEAFVLEHFEKPIVNESGFKSDSSLSAEQHINKLWNVLTREPEEGGTIIPLRKSYVVPGGRFGEVYYWDSYFTMLGLQVAGKDSLIENMVLNFAQLIQDIGHIPNGNRSYYLSRSQPPFFSLMVELLAEVKQEDQVLLRFLPQLQKEYQYWMAVANSDQAEAQNKAKTKEDGSFNKVVFIEEGQILNRYYDNSDKPRPEAYKEDVETAKKSGRDTKEVYRHLRSGAESGWDYSSRWLRDGKSLETIHTTEILPVDLNALLYHLEEVLEKAYSLSEKEKGYSDSFKALKEKRKALFKTYFWDESKGFYFDYDFVSKKRKETYSLAGVYPLFFGIASEEQAQKVADKIEALFMMPGGVNSTLYETGQQWDAPNGWAPLQWMTIKGLRNYGHTELADEIKNRWVANNLRVYKNTGKMVEKYNVNDLSLQAGGGEYPVQDGFGWTNGVLLKLLSEE